MAIDDRLFGAVAKYQRARRHTQEFAIEFDTWYALSPYKIFTKRESPSEHALVFRWNIPPDRQRLSIILGDAVHNARCALDHLMFGLAVREQSDFAETVNAQNIVFPCIRDAAKMEDGGVRGRTHVSDTDVRDVISRHQPCNSTPQDPDLDPLAILVWLDNWDKHRLLFPTTIVSKFSMETRPTRPEIAYRPSANGEKGHGGRVHGRFVTTDDSFLADEELNFNAAMGVVPLIPSRNTEAPLIEAGPFINAALDRVQDVMAECAQFFDGDDPFADHTVTRPDSAPWITGAHAATLDEEESATLAT